MRKKAARAAGLTGLAAGVLALAGAAAAPALAGVTDTGGTVVVALRHATLEGLAKASIIVLPTGSGAASYGKGGAERLTLKVTGGTASFVGTYGSLDLAGSLEILDGATGKSVTLTKLSFNYASGDISGTAGGRPVVIGQIGGAELGQQHAGPPTSQTFTASAVFTTKAGAAYLDAQLRSKYFKAGQDLGSFAADYDTATTS